MAVLLVAPTAPLPLSGGQADGGPASSDDFKIYTEHPRLFLRPQRLRLLKREVERKSPRWRQFDMLITGKARMPEQGLALALHYQASGNRESGVRAVEWALGATDLRQIAIVFDWCQPLLDEPQSRALAGKLQRGIGMAQPPTGVRDARARALAAVALSDHVPGAPEKALDRLCRSWWNARMVPALKQGEDVVAREDWLGVFELLHAIRDNLNLDLREPLGAVFKDLPLYSLISYYPASYPAAENEYRIPAAKGVRVDLERAAISRTTELMMLAYDPNALENQFVQGWLMHDRFAMQGPFGSPYEFLWANPYHPGLSYYNLPLLFHDSRFGRLFVRSSWDDDARWLGYFQGELQLFDKGEPRIIAVTASGSSPIRIEETLVTPGAAPLRFTADRETTAAFVLGLEPSRAYDIEVDDEELREEKTDRGGILALSFPAGLRGTVRIRKSGTPPLR
jgi:hypothetical protein